MGRPVPVCRLLCRGDRYQRDVRCRARRSGAGHLVLVPVWLRLWIRDDLSGPAFQRFSPEGCNMNHRRAVSLRTGSWSLVTRISVYWPALPVLLILGSQASTAAAAGVSEVPCPPEAIAVEPGASIQAAVDRSGDGAVFCIKNGTHRIQ